MRAADEVGLAATWTPNPDHPATWSGFFLVLLGVAGCLIVMAGVAVTIALWRVQGARKWGNHVIGPVIVTVGLVAAGFGFRLF
ncbi:hypothetical protein N8I84_29100 [Streptomyces cynarae]|uniref:Integral membrane protein n=1 Tax=Streptomyces cynarae TaxID=2981134 RepID=A0ABY6E6U5_9ACTN|nr:hypothetical protein [Streptomyces cynarae]UXY22304.1 hypothetical protein N8I84_29100 [Streptomyces cynarae]